MDGEYLALESGTPAMQALLANELQIVFTTGALAITANLQGADITIIAATLSKIPLDSPPRNKFHRHCFRRAKE